MGMEAHRLADVRSLAFHAAVAARLREDPRVLAMARARVAGWLTTGRVHLEYAEAWAGLLASPLDELCDSLVVDDERMQTLRSVTPFAGAIDARTRWRIWRDARVSGAGREVA